MKKTFLFLLVLLASSGAFAQAPVALQRTINTSSSFPKTEEEIRSRTVRYDLYIGDTVVNYAGKPKKALAANGSIPMPTLSFTEGDTAEIYVHNTLDEETSIHWHGLLLPNHHDGVPHLTTQPIKAGKTHLFKFPLIQNGTYWYHSHTGTQEQLGMYGSFIIYKRGEGRKGQYPVLLSDWTNTNPNEINRSLHNANDWPAIKKRATQSYSEAVQSGQATTKLANEAKRMAAMDVSDVAYDKFLINGKAVDAQSQYKAGDKVRLRISNGGASTYFWLTYAGGKITVVANDGEDVEPVEVDRLIIAVAETYDVIVAVPENKSYEFLATSEDRTGSTSLWLGSGPKVPATVLPKLKYFEGMKMMNGMMKMNGNLDTSSGMQMANQVMDMNTVMYPEITGEEKPSKETKAHNDAGGTDNMPQDIVTLNYGMLRSTKVTTLPEAPTRTFNFELTGNMNRYVWSMDNKVLSESDKIMIKKGENIRIVLYNNTMMRHPMHLHGHFFRVVNGQGERSPLKNVLDIMPMEVDTIEFAATEDQDWFFHCHILYHMMSGMGRVFSYENSSPNPELPNPEKSFRMLKKQDRMLHPMVRVGIESNGSDGEVMVGNTRYQLSTEWRVGWNRAMGYETESHFGRYIGKNQWLFPYIGWDFRKRDIDPLEKNMFGQRMTLPGKNLFGQANTKNFRRAVHMGVQYTLPMLVVADGSIDSDGKLRFQLSREDIPVSPRVRMNFLANTDKEYSLGMRYIVNKYFSLSTHYDSDMGYGAGITLSY